MSVGPSKANIGKQIHFWQEEAGSRVVVGDHDNPPEPDLSS